MSRIPNTEKYKWQVPTLQKLSRKVFFLFAHFRDSIPFVQNTEHHFRYRTPLKKKQFPEVLFYSFLSSEHCGNSQKITCS
jgi:hypothetical protein